MNEHSSSEVVRSGTEDADKKESRGGISKRSPDDWTTLIISLLCIAAGIGLAFCLVKRDYQGTSGWVAAITFVLIGGLVVILRHVELYGYDGRRRLILRREPEEYGAGSGDDD